MMSPVATGVAVSNRTLVTPLKMAPCPVPDWLLVKMPGVAPPTVTGTVTDGTSHRNTVRPKRGVGCEAGGHQRVHLLVAHVVQGEELRAHAHLGVAEQGGCLIREALRARQLIAKERDPGSRRRRLP